MNPETMVKPNDSRAVYIAGYLARLFRDNGGHGLSIVEIGTIRNPGWKYGDGHSTRYIAEWIRDNPPKWPGEKHVFHSIDKYVGICRRFLDRLNLSEFVALHEGDGIEVLRNLSLDYVDLAYIDGPDDPEFTVACAELLRARASSGAIFMFDDWDFSDPVQVKGRILKPALEEAGVEIRMYDRIAVIHASDWVPANA